MRTLELLAPAKNLECGKAAIDHGADAVYIGAPRFGARAAAGNSLEDIKELCDYAHQFGAKVHVTVNTIIYDEELEDTLQMIAELDKVHVDALLLQDMGVLREVKARKLWSRELHSSTQCDTRTPEKAIWLSTVGFNRVVLARELSVEEIKKIHKAVPNLDLEVFVHGALCVSYSGVCYASEKCFHRSANRGECAQFCRMKFNLFDSNNKEIEHQRHLLSLKDLCQIDHLEELANAGACSFKIEGRLKDINYVKNVVTAYSKKLNEIVSKHPTRYRRASYGNIDYSFVPDLKKTFNRGYTNYFLNGRQPDIASFDTPKAMGEYVGKVKEFRGDVSFNVASVASFANGDGLCFINDERELEGFRVNRAEGNRLYPLHMPTNLRPGMSLYRNNDQAFENILARTTAERRIPLVVRLAPCVESDGDDNNHEGTPNAVSVVAFLVTDQANGKGIEVAHIVKEFSLELAKRSQMDNIILQMRRMGGTIYECMDVFVNDGLEKYFIPNSVLGILRRVLVEAIDRKIAQWMDSGELRGRTHLMDASSQVLDEVGEHVSSFGELVWQPAYAKWGYLYNIANEQAADFYEVHGLSSIKPAFELGNHEANQFANHESLIMQCRHCIRYSLGYCVKRGGKKPTWKEPLYLQLGDGRRFRLEFACNECQMNVYSTE